MNEEMVNLILKIIELNAQIIKQNQILLQAITTPTVFIGEDK